MDRNNSARINWFLIPETQKIGVTAYNEDACNQNGKQTPQPSPIPINVTSIP